MQSESRSLLVPRAVGWLLSRLDGRHYRCRRPVSPESLLIRLKTNNKARETMTRAFIIYPGSDLLSHAVTSAVPSALEGLTTVFGMGTGVAPPALPPGIPWGDAPPPSILPRAERSPNRAENFYDNRIRTLAQPSEDMSTSVVKPHGRLVPLSSTPHGAYTCGLSTW